MPARKIVLSKMQRYGRRISNPLLESDNLIGDEALYHSGVVLYHDAHAALANHTRNVVV